MKMRKTNILLLLGIAALVGVHAYMYLSGGSKFIRRVTLLDRSVFSADSIAIDRHGDTDVVLARTEDEWRLQKPYPAGANMENISRLLDSLAFGKIHSSYSDGDLAKFGKTRSDYGLGNSRLKVSVNTGRDVKVVSFGKKTPSGDGVFVAVAGDPMIYVADVRMLDAADIPAESFRMQSVFVRDVANVKTFDIKMGQSAATRFIRESDRWKALSLSESGAGKTASSVKVAEFISLLSKSVAKSFVWPVGASNETAVASSSLLAGYGLDAESAVTVTLRDKVFPDEQIVLGRAASDGLVYALVQNGSAIVTVDGALKDMADSRDFIDSRLYPYEAGKVSRIAISDGTAECMLARSEEGAWRLDTPISAVADNAAAEKLLHRILSLTADDRDEGGVAVSLSTNAPVEKVSHNALFEGVTLAELRSREIVKIDPSDVKRIVAMPKGLESSAVVFDRDLRTWKTDASSRNSFAAKESIEGVLAALNPLKALRVVSLSASESDLHRYGLDNPWFQVAIDFFSTGSIRRNILIGEKTQDGYYAMMGAFDAVFVISEESLMRLTAPILTE